MICVSLFSFRGSEWVDRPSWIWAPLCISPDSGNLIVPSLVFHLLPINKTTDVFVSVWFLFILWFLWFFWFLCCHQSGRWQWKGKWKDAASAALLSSLTGRWASGRRPAAPRTVKECSKRTTMPDGGERIPTTAKTTTPGLKPAWRKIPDIWCGIAGNIRNMFKRTGTPRSTGIKPKGFILIYKPSWIDNLPKS